MRLPTSSRSPSAAITALLLFVISSPALAQDQRQQRREFIEGLLRTLVESQLDRDDQPQPPRPAPANQQVTDVRRLVDAFARETTRLAHQLDAESRQQPQLRHVLGDLIALNAKATQLADASRRVQSLDRLEASLQELDRDWRILSYRLEHRERISAVARKMVEILNETNVALNSLCEIPPQVPYDELVRRCESIGASLDHLVEDLQIELGRSFVHRDLVSRGQRLHQRTLLFCDWLIDRRDYATLAPEFETLFRDWQRFALETRALQNRHIERGVRRVDELFADMHELLWMPLPISYPQLKQLTEVLRQDVDRLFNAVTLNVLLQIPKAGAAITASSEFYGLVENFAAGVESQEPVELLRQDYTFLVQAWPTLSNYFARCRETQVSQALAAIEDSFVTIRDTLRLAPDVDWVALQQLMAATSVLTERLHADVKTQIVASRRYKPDFRSQAEMRSDEFHNAVHELHDHIQRRNASGAQDGVSRAANTWNLFQRDVLRRLPTNYRTLFDATAERLAPRLVEIQTLLN